MKQRTLRPGGMVSLMSLLCLIALFAGCATHKINWNARIGNYTYDQAVLDYGPPDKQASLKDGTVVAEWLLARGFSQGYVDPFPGYYYGRYGYYHPPLVAYPITTSPDYFQRMTFAPDGKLSDWKKVLH